MTTQIGLTGGVGMGKSAAAEILRKRGIPVIDSDDIARRVVELGMPALMEIAEAFGTTVMGADGRLNRAALAQLIFADTTQRQRLEAIIHPRVKTVWQAQHEVWRASGVKVGVTVIPLLFETGSQVHFDRVICVACTEQTQRERLRLRGWSDDQIEQRNAAQWSIGRKIEMSAGVIWSEGGLDVLEQQLARLI